MLQLKNITKIYKTEDYTQKALDEVSVCFRENEFASILGPSGSGKTTLLNIIGGLDTYDDGELIINEVSTKDYKDRDWDSYRNHRIGFVFQSYNLIAHQTVLANVELALTLSGVSKSVRRKKAKDALKKVGLEKHINKKPSQLSGGQMQRVAIARALVNDPDILLADEPTGALDSDTSIQIMDIIKEIAKEKLVIMVTHNPELATDYSTRIIKLKDGRIIDDTNPYDGNVDTKRSLEEEKKKSRKTSMNLRTALSLSLNNLLTKKGRTILTSFAGSIGIIGIALILSLSSGVNSYILDVQKDTMLSYPITIEEASVDYSAMFGNYDEKEVNHDTDALYTDVSDLERSRELSSNISKNNLTKFKSFLDDKNSEISKYIGESGVVYKYNTSFKVYTYDTDDKLINTDGSSFDTFDEATFANGMTVSRNTTNEFSMLMKGNNELISKAITDNYDLVYGSWPKNYTEVVLVMDKNNEISVNTLYNLGYLPSSEYKEILDKIDKKEEVVLESKKIDYENIIGKTFNLLTASDFYIKNSNGLYDNVLDNDGKVLNLVKAISLELKVVGIIKSNFDSETALINGSVGYTYSLNDWIINHTNESKVVKEQENNQGKNVLNGLKFSVSSDEEKVNETINYLSKLSISEKAKIATYIRSDNNISGMLYMNEEQLASALDVFLKNPSKDVLLSIYNNYISLGSYEENMDAFGKVSLDSPSAIEIYTDSFEDKNGVKEAINNYNDKESEDNKINYTDYVGLLMTSVTDIVNMISYVLIAFVSISLVVSSIMIAIITYISVLERTKEIGVLRAIGASKKDITRVFNAETFIEGLVAGLLGIGTTLVLTIPINAIIKDITEIDKIAKLPIMGALVLILISIILTVVAGLIPSKMAAKKDPVVALRSE